MRVIGTSGHVDHGKTALIRALTGIDTDRLPEEKSRGLTIDLGFAHFEGPDGTPIGVIDVPGHERFIRNMVAGSWSLDCAVLVVAADDGWMQQSTDHLKVLTIMGVDHIICAVTKTDAVSVERIEEVENEALIHILEITGRSAPAVRVSSLTGEGIEDLKSTILSVLSGFPEKEETRPYLYIDRVFSIQGAGVVVTGSLAGGPLMVDDSCFLLPSGEKVRIRGLQSYYSSVNEAFPVSRVACNLQGISKSELYRGCCLSSDRSDFMVGNDFLVTVDDIDTLISSARLKNHSECEIAAGTFHSPATVHYHKDTGLCRIKLGEKTAVRWNQPFVLIRHGGSRIIGGGKIIWRWNNSDRPRFIDAFRSLPSPLADNHRSAFSLVMKGFIPLSESENEAFYLKEETIRSGDYLFLASFADAVRKTVLCEAGKPGGISLDESEGKTGLSRRVLKALTAPLVENGDLSLRNNILFSGGIRLSPFGNNLLKRIRDAGKEGFDPGKEKIPGAQKELRNIARSGLAVPLENGIYYSNETYGGVVSEILDGRKEGDRFTIPEVRERTSLSRKYSIPVLNRMEQDGYVKRDGDLRLVLRTPGSGPGASSRT